MELPSKHRPGEIRDAIFEVLGTSVGSMPVKDIEESVASRLDGVSPSSVRSYLRLNTPGLFERDQRGVYRLREQAAFPYVATQEDGRNKPKLSFHFGRSQLIQDDCFSWLKDREPESIHAVITDPPYGLVEYSPVQQEKLRQGRGGVWRIPPSFDGSKRSPVPRFTILKPAEIEALRVYFTTWARVLLPALVPGAVVLVASNPLVSFVVADGLARGGLERRGEIVRLVMTMRGGDRPKAAHEEFRDVSVMPRSMWEPWLVYRKPIEGRVQDNLRKWKTGGFRRPSDDKPFGDVIASSPTRRQERAIAPHPTLKPQAFLRKLVRAALPLAEGVILDPFAGSGSTVAAAEALGYESIGLEEDPVYFEMACASAPMLAALTV